jgi:hypothetical protein
MPATERKSNATSMALHALYVGGMVKKLAYLRASRKARERSLDGKSCLLAWDLNATDRISRNDLTALEDRLKDMETLLRHSQDSQAARDDLPVEHVNRTSPLESNSSLTSATPSENSVVQDQFSFPPHDVAMRLGHGFLATCNMMFPIFTPEKVLRRMKQDWPPNKRDDLVWHTTVMIILGFAHRLQAISNPAEADTENEEATRYLTEALDVAPMLSYSKPSLETAQVLLGVASMLRTTAMPDPARMFVSSSVRILQDLDAHKEPDSKSPNPQLRDELGRVFWVAYIQDKNLALHTGKPPVLYEEDISRQPLAYSESWGIVRSLDHTFRVDFFVAAHRLAAIQGLIWSRVQSATARKTRLDLLKAQSELNPLLAAWKNDFPFEFKREALIGRWPKHSILYIIMLHFQYFQSLLELNKEPEESTNEGPLSGDFEPARSLHSHTYSTAPHVIEAARDALDLASLAPRGNFAHVW